jgi:hypothetical protein
MALHKVKVLASQAEAIYKYKNIKTKLLQCCANIYFDINVTQWDPTSDDNICTAIVYLRTLSQNNWPDDDM